MNSAKNKTNIKDTTSKRKTEKISSNVKRNNQRDNNKNTYHHNFSDISNNNQSNSTLIDSKLITVKRNKNINKECNFNLSLKNKIYNKIFNKSLIKTDNIDHNSAYKKNEVQDNAIKSKSIKDLLQNPIYNFNRSIINYSYFGNDIIDFQKNNSGKSNVTSTTISNYNKYYNSNNIKDLFESNNSDTVFNRLTRNDLCKLSRCNSVSGNIRQSNINNINVRDNINYKYKDKENKALAVNANVNYKKINDVNNINSFRTLSTKNNNTISTNSSSYVNINAFFNAGNISNNLRYPPTTRLNSSRSVQNICFSQEKKLISNSNLDKINNQTIDVCMRGKELNPKSNYLKKKNKHTFDNKTGWY